MGAVGPWGRGARGPGGWGAGGAGGAGAPECVCVWVCAGVFKVSSYAPLEATNLGVSFVAM